jgi:hypothetical protein
MFAWLVILAGMGMAASFIYMWVISLLEMWLYKPVFVSGLGMHYLQWRDNLKSEENKARMDKIAEIMNQSANQLDRLVHIGLEKWSSTLWPFLQSLFKK